MSVYQNEKQNGHHVEGQIEIKQIEESEPLTWKFWKKRRYVVVLMAFLGFFNVYSLRVNLSVAIVAMTENRTIIDEAGQETYHQDFAWDSKQKGLILSSFFYGYILTQFIGGFIGSKIGGNLVFGIGIGTTAILTLLTPLAAKHSLQMLLAVRIIEGIFEKNIYFVVLFPLSKQIEESEPLTWKFWKKRRYVVVLMAFLGFFNVYSLRVNLSVAIVAMTENRTIIDEAGQETYHQDFAWDSKQKGLILSSFFYGYILTQFIGGFIGSKIGGNLVFGIGIGTTAILTLLTPLAAKHSLQMLLAVRIIEGIFEGVTFPCIHAVWSRWAPPMERSRMASIAFAGNYAGTVVAMPSSGLLASSYGWESVFYVFGSIGVVWFVAWMLVVREGPEKDRFCSKDEREYIQSQLGSVGRQNIKHPWKEIFTSTAVYAIIASHFSENWGFYTLLTQLPTFLKDTLDFNLDKTGFVSAIPYLTMGILLGVSGYLADYLQVKGIWTTTQVRRNFNCGAFLAQTIFMILCAYLLDPTWSVVCITIAVGLGAFAWSGFAVNHLDIAPQHASVLMGISNTFATIPGIVSPLLTGYIVTDQTADEWRIVFYISAGIYLIGCVVYWFWASGEVQEWAKSAETMTLKDPSTISKPVQGYVNEAVELRE